MRDGVALGVQNLSVGAALGAALSVQQTGHHVHCVVLLAVERTHILCFTAALVVLAVVGKAVVVLDGLGQAVLINANALSQCVDAVVSGQLGQLLFRHCTSSLDLALLGLINDVPDLFGEGGVLPDAVLIQVAVTHRLTLVDKAITVGAHQNGSTGVDSILCQRCDHIAGDALFDRISHTAQTEQALIAVHVPQICTHSLCHLDAIAGVELTTAGCIVDDVQVVLHHLLVALKTAGADAHAVQGTDVHFLTITLHGNAHDRLGDGVLNEAFGRGAVPYINGIHTVGHVLLQALIQIAVAGTLVGGPQSHLLMAGHLRVLGAHSAHVGAAHVHAGPVHVLIFVKAELIGQDVGHVGNTLGNRINDLRLDVTAAGPSRIVTLCRVLVTVGVSKQLATDLGVAASLALFALFHDDHLGTVVGSSLGCYHTGCAHAHDHHVILGIPADSVCKRKLLLFGRCSRAGSGSCRAAGTGSTTSQNPYGTQTQSTLDEALARDLFHDVFSLFFFFFSKCVKHSLLIHKPSIILIIKRNACVYKSSFLYYS